MEQPCGDEACCILCGVDEELPKDRPRGRVHLRGLLKGCSKLAL